MAAVHCLIRETATCSSESISPRTLRPLEQGAIVALSATPLISDYEEHYRPCLHVADVIRTPRHTTKSTSTAKSASSSKSTSAAMPIPPKPALVYKTFLGERSKRTAKLCRVDAYWTMQGGPTHGCILRARVSENVDGATAASARPFGVSFLLLWLSRSPLVSSPAGGVLN